MLGTIKVSLLPLLATTSLVACIDLAGDEQDDNDLSIQEQASCVRHDLAQLRRDTKRYRDLDVADADGFKLGIDGMVMGCVAHPTLGAMGYHYARQDRFDDPTIDELEPEALVYYTAPDGTRKLGAVEWVVPKDAWDAVHGVDAPAPVVYGKELTVINPVLNWYVAHAWVWKPNPAGILSDWNPKVTCP